MVGAKVVHKAFGEGTVIGYADGYIRIRFAIGEKEFPFLRAFDTTFELMNIRTQLLTVEQYAQSYGVTVTTVRQWIRRGKIRSAIKMGSEWRIPELAEVMDRGYTDGHYTRKEYLSDIPAEYAFFNDYDYVDICQNRKDKRLFDLCFSKKFDIMDYTDEEEAFAENIRNIQIDREERERFELYLIASPFVETSDIYIDFR